jgi:two-component system nitrogen regulation response regulator GlnG
MNKPAQVWVIDDDRAIRWVLERALSQAGMQPILFESAEQALASLPRGLPDSILVDIRMGGMSGLSFLEQLSQSHPEIPVIIMTAYSDLDSAVAAYQGGAFEYLPKPFDINEAVELVHRSMQQRRRSAGKAAEPAASHPQEIVGSAPAMQEVFRAIGRLSRSNLTVLITGESGSGKELVAQALHRHSPRSDGPFIALNMAAIPRELLESELFGHERGAFTGALSQRRGRFEQADGGTLFLDEIGDMPAELQTRLLRVLADGTFFRVGGHSPVRVNVRIVAATHQNLQKRVAQGDFREDLYHRLNVIQIQLPPLRQRREDIAGLAQHFLHRIAKELKVECKVLHPDTQVYLSQLDWPGNVRQLENTCRWLTVMASGQEILVEDLPAELRSQGPMLKSGQDWEAGLRQWVESQLRNGVNDLLADAQPRFERILIEAALQHTGGHRQEAARLLGWGRNTLARKIKELGMGDKDDDAMPKEEA